MSGNVVPGNFVLGASSLRAWEGSVPGKISRLGEFISGQEQSQNGDNSRSIVPGESELSPFGRAPSGTVFVLGVSNGSAMGQHESQNGTISPESVLGLPAPDNLRPSYLLGKLG